jgi:hypothetical protein
MENWNQQVGIGVGDGKIASSSFWIYVYWLLIISWNFPSIVVGQQIPAYFYGDGKEDFVVAESIEDALN